MRSKGRSMTKKSAQIAFDDVLRQVTEGNEEAFQQLYLHYHDRLFQFARMYLHQQQAAEDVVADLFFQLWKSRGMLGGIENFNAYIYRAVRARAGAVHLDEDEFINVGAYTIAELRKKIYSGEIEDSKTIAAIMAYAVKYNR